jgi:hypothetical protein
MNISEAFVDADAYHEIGKAMAAFIMESAQRPGFMRTLEFHRTNHTVEEFTKQEQIQVDRIKRKHRHLTLVDDRYLVRALRRQAYAGPKSTRRRYTADLRPYTSD